MAAQTQTRQTGDTQVALAVACVRPDGTAVNLTDKTMKFAMVDSQGNSKVAETASNVAIVSAAAGTVKYTFQDADVDEAGVFYAYFISEDGLGNQETFPVKTGDLRVVIQSTS